MKKYAFISVICIILLFWAVQDRALKKTKRLLQLQAVELSMLNDSVATYKTKSGEFYFKLQAEEVEKRNLKDALEVAGYDLQELKAMDIRWRNLVSTLRMELASAGQGQTLITDTFRIVEHTTDTIWFQKVHPWTNGYLSLYNATIENKELNFNYRYQTEINLFQTREKKNVTVVTATLTDPYAVITTANSITVVHKRKLWEKPLLWGLAGFLVGVFVL